jgi:very-short-patch-repair endonuclease
MPTGNPGMLRRPLSAETRAKISLAHKTSLRAQAARNALTRIFSPETRAKMSMAHKGRVLPPITIETRAKISAALTGKKRAPRSLEWCAKIGAGKLGKKIKPRTAEHCAKLSVAHKASARAQAQRAKIRRQASPTSIERSVRDVLNTLGESYIFQYPIGRYTVDFYLPDRNLIIECDGEYWHRDKSRDDLRDANLRDFGYYIVHIPGKAIKTDTRAALEAAWSLTPHDTFDGEKE